MTFQAGLGRNTRFLGWGVGFADFDNDGWPDILSDNGHVYPEVGESGDRIGLPRSGRCSTAIWGTASSTMSRRRRGPGHPGAGPGPRLRVRRLR